VVKGIVGGEPFGLGGGGESVVAGDEGENEVLGGQPRAVVQGHRQLHGVVGLEGMLPREDCRLEEVVTTNSNELVTPGHVIHELVKHAIPDRPPDASGAVQHRERSRHLGALRSAMKMVWTSRLPCASVALISSLTQVLPGSRMQYLTSALASK